MLDTVIVYVPVVPTVKLPVCVFVITRSVALTGVMTFDVLFPVYAGASTSVVLVTVAVLLTLGKAVDATETLMVIAFGFAAPAAIAVVLVQLIFALPAVLLPAPP